VQASLGATWLHWPGRLYVSGHPCVALWLQPPWLCSIKRTRDNSQIRLLIHSPHTGCGIWFLTMLYSSCPALTSPLPLKEGSVAPTTLPFPSPSTLQSTKGAACPSNCPSPTTFSSFSFFFFSFSSFSTYISEGLFNPMDIY
jgi:hypothetical protein